MENLISRRRAIGLLTSPALSMALPARAVAGHDIGLDKNRLAVLIAAPLRGEAPMQNDLGLIYEAVRRRGFAPEEFLTLSGALNRRLLLALIREASESINGWKSGELFLFYSGHGSFEGSTLADARPGLQLMSDLVLWDEVFAALALPSGVRLTLLPDC